MSRFIIEYTPSGMPGTSFERTIEAEGDLEPETAKMIFENQHENFKVIKVSKLDPESMQ